MLARAATLKTAHLNLSHTLTAARSNLPVELWAVRAAPEDHILAILGIGHFRVTVSRMLSLKPVHSVYRLVVILLS